jgi:asparagine synthetase B (glutamine-hydrolysing)
VLLSGEGADELMGGYTLQSLTSISSACDYRYLAISICFQNHCTINCCALLKFKKNQISFFLMVRISILRILQPRMENTHKRIPKKIYEEAKSLYQMIFGDKALYFDQHT